MTLSPMASVQGLPARAAAEVILDAGQRLPLEVWRLGQLPFREAGERELLVPRYLCSRFRGHTKLLQRRFKKSVRVANLKFVWGLLLSWARKGTSRGPDQNGRRRHRRDAEEPSHGVDDGRVHARVGLLAGGRGRRGGVDGHAVQLLWVVPSRGREAQVRAPRSTFYGNSRTKCAGRHENNRLASAANRSG
jgi:hypothetical protein